MEMARHTIKADVAGLHEMQCPCDSASETCRGMHTQVASNGHIEYCTRELVWKNTLLKAPACRTARTGGDELTWARLQRPGHVRQRVGAVLLRQLGKQVAEVGIRHL